MINKTNITLLSSHNINAIGKEDYRLDLDAGIQPPFSVTIPSQTGETSPAGGPPTVETVVGGDVIDLVSDADDDDFYV